ncbi:hypothetical protein RRSWK_06546 [Rhodopirellula sp. SWK7]|nr:hypothetical protein RRSWK_06546 [Rhodopirellula sp. SWK7]
MQLARQSTTKPSLRKRRPGDFVSETERFDVFEMTRWNGTRISPIAGGLA